MSSLPPPAAERPELSELCVTCRAINMASLLEIDGVIDPAETRTWILRGLKSVPARPRRRRFIDTW
jgi:acetyl-CoA carboxylase carboxyltransferase component